jgi:hypothetical protein
MSDGNANSINPLGMLKKPLRITLLKACLYACVLVPAAGAPAAALRSGDVPDYDYDPDEDEDDGGIFDLKKLQVGVSTHVYVGVGPRGGDGGVGGCCLGSRQNARDRIRAT